jgi:hypothetical protein
LHTNLAIKDRQTAQFLQKMAPTDIESAEKASKIDIACRICTEKLSNPARPVK